MGWWIPLAMVGASVIKSMNEKKRADKQRAIVAETQRMSPWTGHWADQSSIQEPNAVGNALQWGVTGMALDQGIDSLTGQENMQNAYIKNLNAGTAKLNAEAANAVMPNSVAGPNLYNTNMNPAPLQNPMAGSWAQMGADPSQLDLAKIQKLRGPNSYWGALVPPRTF